MPINPNLIFRVACDEAESWLMADKTGFSKFLGIKKEILPGLKKPDFRNPDNVELNFPYKPSLYMMRELAVKSSKKIIVQLHTIGNQMNIELIILHKTEQLKNVTV